MDCFDNLSCALRNKNTMALVRWCGVATLLIQILKTHGLVTFVPHIYVKLNFKSINTNGKCSYGRESKISRKMAGGEGGDAEWAKALRER